MQVKKIIAVLLTVCLLFSLSVPAYAVDDVYNIADDVVPAPVIYYTEDYYPGLLAQMRNSMTFANNRLAHGSFATMNYNPSIFYREGSVHTSLENFSIPFNSLTPYVTADQMDISGVYSIPRTTLLQGNMLIAFLPSTSDAYFDFQSSNIAFDQQDANANTFYINGTLTFNLRNLWNFSGSYETTSFYLASDPLAVQLLIDGKAYGDIIDVTGYTSPFTALYNGGIPANASVTFNNLKVYYQGDTPDMIGFRVYTGSAFTDGQYNYNSAGDFVAVDVTNTVTMRFTDLPDITFVNEGGDGYAGDLSGISSALGAISGKLDSVISNLVNPTYGYSWLQSLQKGLFDTSSDNYPYLGFIVQYLSEYSSAGFPALSLNGNVGTFERLSVSSLVRYGFLGLRSLMVDSSGNSWLGELYDELRVTPAWSYVTGDGVISSGGTKTFASLSNSFFVGITRLFRNTFLDNSGYTVFMDKSNLYLNRDGSVSTLSGAGAGITYIMSVGLQGLASLSRNAQSYVADTVFPWQSYNMQTHELNAATNITGQNNLFFTAFQSMEDKLGRLAYVFGSDEDLALKDSADPGTDAFRENFGGGLSLGQISNGADVVEGVNGLFDSGYSFGDAFTEIAGEAGFFVWFTPECAAALDSTGSVMALDDSDPYNMQLYYDHVQKVKEKREAGDD